MAQPNLVSVLQEYRFIFGVCPCCGELFRLSDANIHIKGRPPKTIFDTLQQQQDGLDRAEVRLSEREASLREAASLRGLLLAKRKLRAIDPVFSAKGIDPQDVKVIFDPVEYVVFKGMNGGHLQAIVLMGRTPDNAIRERVQSSIERTVKKGNYEWKTLRVGDDGNIKYE